jgi:sugar phosphate isomerase/epimerase
VAAVASPARGAAMPFPPGLQLYSLRYMAAKDLPGALGAARTLGFHELEAGDFYNRSPEEFRRLAAGYGLTVSCMGAEWDALKNSAVRVAVQAHQVGASFVTCTSIPRSATTGKRLTLDDVKMASAAFNRWGTELAREKLRLCFHPHGPEFVPGPDGTLFDTMAREMDPRAANFEMDVFWFVFGNQDPAAMLRRYKGRFLSMHVKDIRKGVARTFDPGTVEEEDSVPLGMGEVDWVSTLAAAKESGVEKYYIEEEHPKAVEQIRQSLAYLKKLTRS